MLPEANGVLAGLRKSDFFCFISSLIFFGFCLFDFLLAIDNYCPQGRFELKQIFAEYEKKKAKDGSEYRSLQG